MQVVKPRLYVVEIPAVAERIENADMIGVGNVRTVRIQHRMVAPCIVHILYHNAPAAVKKGYDIPLRILAVEICPVVVFVQ